MSKVPPYLPDLLTMPIALVASIHFFRDKVKALAPAAFLTPSNSRSLKSELCCLEFWTCLTT